jgi:hypothetical protein
MLGVWQMTGSIAVLRGVHPYPLRFQPILGTVTASTIRKISQTIAAPLDISFGHLVALHDRAVASTRTEGELSPGFAAYSALGSNG